MSYGVSCIRFDLNLTKSCLVSMPCFEQGFIRTSQWSETLVETTLIMRMDGIQMSFFLQQSMVEKVNNLIISKTIVKLFITCWHAHTMTIA